jgi:peptidoglycan/xylan/chitin deacetylase (PgdA/CDA1 family)
MKNGLSSVGERELLARGLFWSGAIFMLSQLPARDSLLVLTYHRIGNHEEDPWDPGVFSATGDEFDEQISFLKRKHWLVTLEEALAFIDGTIKEKARRFRVLITFDDGYLDNYKIAFPILRSHGVQGVFFLCTNLVGSGFVPWWDHIAFLVKTARHRRFSLSYPAGLDVDVDRKGLRASLRSILDMYEMAKNTDPERFIRELGEATRGRDLPAESRRYLNWDEAREMINGGMAIGAHSHSHPRLSKLEPEEQRRELAQSRVILGEQLGIKADVFAYPFGSVTAFTEQTQRLAQETGYRAAFSYYGGVANKLGTIERYNLKRVPVAGQSWERFWVQTGICRLTGSFWP